MEDQQPLDSMELDNNYNPNDELSSGLKVVSFCFPIVGAIIYFSTNAEMYPTKKKEACNYALYGFGFGIVLRVIMAGLSN
jgi:hypothetical protein